MIKSVNHGCQAGAIGLGYDCSCPIEQTTLMETHIDRIPDELHVFLAVIGPIGKLVRKKVGG